MGEMAKIALGGDKASISQSKISGGGTSSPNGNLASLALKGGTIALNPNTSLPKIDGAK